MEKDDYDSDLDTTVAAGVAAPPLNLGGVRRKAKPTTAALPAAAKEATIKSFVASGAAAEAPAFEPPPALAAAVADAQLLELAHKDTVYSNAQSSTELPVGTWALYNKPTDEEPEEGECRPLALRIRQHSASAPIQEHLLAITPEGKWAVVGVPGSTSTPYQYDALGELVKEYRQAAQASAVIRTLHTPVDLPTVTDYVWYGREFTSDAAALAAIDRRNLKTYTELERHGAKRGCELQAPNYDVPHVFITRFLVGPKAFLLGFHRPTGVWFILDPRATWVRMSHSLAEVVGTTPINRGD